MHQPQPHCHTQVHRSLVVSALVMLFLLVGAFAGRSPIQRSAAQASLLPVAYVPLIAKDGPSVSPTVSAIPTRTATSSPTATTTATVTQTPACNSVYPIGIDASLLDEHGFVPPTNAAELSYYGLYSDGTYTNKTQRRLFQRFPSDYYFLAWQHSDPGDLSVFSAALTGTGTLYQGFDEVVPWPDLGSLGPDGYPLYPHQLSPGDWILLFQDWTDSMQGRAALDNHIIHRTVLTLPIYDQVVGSGSSASLHMIRLGTFLLRGYNLGQPFLDLVALGDAAPLNCTTAATATPVDSGRVTPSFATVTMTPSPTATP